MGGAVVALVPAAGRGMRLGAGVPKAFVELAGRPLLWHAVRNLLDAGCVSEVVVAVDRADLRIVQTPQGFDAALLRRAHAAADAAATDDAGLVERLGEPVVTVPGDPLAFKITTPFDLAVAEAVLA